MTTFSMLPSLPTFLPGTNPATDGDTFLAALPTLVSQGNTIGTEVQTNYDNSYEYNKRVNISLVRLAAYLASSSSNSTLATSLRNATLWVSGTTYSLNTYVFSPTNFRLYRRKVAGAGTTDPITDTANWNLVALELGTNLPSIRPTLSLNFTAGEVLDHRITFSRSSSATRYNRKGLIELVGVNQPRFDYDPSTLQAKGLLIEESRANLLTYSEQFDNGAWTKTRATVSANAAIAPDGTTTADKLIEDTTASNSHFVTQNYAATNTTLSGSFFVKSAERSKCRLEISNFLNHAAAVDFDLTNGSFVVSTAGATDYTNTQGSIVNAGNGWWRISISATKGSVNSNNFLTLTIRNDAGNTIYTGDGSSGIYIWGAQLEAGAFPTSYIPTTSTSVTRSADTASMSGINFSSWFNPLEGTFAFDVCSSGIGTVNQAALTLTDSLGTSRITMFRNTSRNFVMQTDVVGVTQFVLSNLSNWPDNTSLKLGSNFKKNSFYLMLNSSLATISTTGSLPVVDRLIIGDTVALNRTFNGWFKTLYYYRRALPVLETSDSTAVS